LNVFEPPRSKKLQKTIVSHAILYPKSYRRIHMVKRRPP